MAATSLPFPKLDLPPKPVQELLTNIGDQIPDRYICPPDEKPDSDITRRSEVTWMNANTIDLQLISASSSPQVEEELGKLRSSLGSWGCFQLINHGQTALMDQVREISEQFFALPLDKKQKHSGKPDSMEGYGSDPVLSETLPLAWNDRLRLQVYPVDQQKYKFWTEDVPNFREILKEYAIELRKVQEEILKALAKCLNLDENSFLKQRGEEGAMLARFNYYPPCPCPDRVAGLLPHSDPTVITILLQDKEVEGLQVLKDDQWFKVPIIPDALFILVGDELEIMSNGVVKSVMHKVVTNRERQRISVAMPCFADANKEIGPLHELVDDERPPLYKKVKNYINIYMQNYSGRERPINATKI